MKILITGAAGNAGVAISRQLAWQGYDLRLADTSAIPWQPDAVTSAAKIEIVRCDTRTPDDVRAAVEGVDGVVHLAAWHSAHKPPVSDATIFAVNVDGTFNITQACREYGIKALVFASSMAYGWGSVYSVTKVVGEELCRAYHRMTGASVAMLRYHEFVPAAYLDYGARLLRNGVDRFDVATATVAALDAALERRIDLFTSIVHTDHGMSSEASEQFGVHGPGWIERNVPGGMDLIRKYAIPLPDRVEQHDLTETARLLGWKPSVGFIEFLRDLRARDARNEDVTSLWVPGELPR